MALLDVLKAAPVSTYREELLFKRLNQTKNRVDLYIIRDFENIGKVRQRSLLRN